MLYEPMFVVAKLLSTRNGTTIWTLPFSLKAVIRVERNQRKFTEAIIRGEITSPTTKLIHFARSKVKLPPILVLEKSSW